MAGKKPHDTAPAGAGDPNALYQALIETTGTGYVILAPDGTVLDANSEYIRLSGGKNLGAIRGRRVTEWTAPEERERNAEAVAACMRLGSIRHLEITYVHADGSRIPVEINATVVESDGTRRILTICRDITSRKLAEQTLLASEARFKSIVNASPMGIHMYELQAEGRLVFVGANPAADKLLGVSHAQFLGKTIEEAFPGLVQTEVPSRYRSVARDGAQWRTEQIDYNEGHIRGAFEVVAFQTGPHRMAALFNNITERKRAEEALMASEVRYRSIVENIADALFIHDLKGAFLDVNENACQMLGYKKRELVGLNLSNVGGSQDPALIERRMEEIVREGSLLFESELAAKDGRRLPVQVSARLVSREDAGIVHSFVRDISEIRKSAEMLRNAQKLESLGVLAGGIAHDFNNLLGGIFGLIDLAQNATREADVREYLGAAMGTMSRARALTQQLLTFAKGGAPMRRCEPLFPFLRDTATFALSGSNVSCSFRVEPGLWNCHYDRNQIGQVVDNIVINAQQAMPAGGAIRIVATNISLGEKPHASIPPGDYVKISIADNGVGIPKEILSRVFDPFFTTKQRGSGLGLATSYSIVRRHGGTIDVESTPGEGASFHVFLPASRENGTAEPASPVPAHRGAGRALFMDDEECLRDTVAAMLARVGYECVCTRDGKEALDAFTRAATENKPFQFVLVDLTVPGGMGGVETLQKLRLFDASTPVFVASGYAEDPVIAEPLRYGFTDSICKPFRTSDLTALLNKHRVGVRHEMMP